MSLSAEIRHAVEIAFTPDDREAIEAALADIRFDDAEWVQAATLALTFGDRALFDDFIVTAQADAHDVAYVLESPELVREGVTRAEVVRRYRLMDLPVPASLAGDG